MARTAMTMGGGGKLAEHLSVGVLAAAYPREQVAAAVAAAERGSKRVRDLPAEAVTYYVMALGLLMAVSTREVLRVLMEGLRWLEGNASVKVASKAAIAQARQRLGAQPLRHLWDQNARPMADALSAGAFYRGLRLVAIDGSTLDVPDTAANRDHFGKPGASRGEAAFPQLRLVGMIETGTHGFFSIAMGPYARSEHALAQKVIPALQSEMLCLADRLFATFPLWQQAVATGAMLLWRIRSNLVLPVEEVLADGSYLSTFFASAKDRRHRRGGLRVRVIDYQLEGHPEAETYRLMTTLLDPAHAPAQELAALYPERWELEGAFDEMKTHLRGGQVVLRSKTPELIEQEFYGLLLAHRAVRALMFKAARKAELDPDRLSFTHAVRVVRRKLAERPAFSP
jgi:Insertion element 4 transposase N-terminal/Transposase DDE domain